MNLHVIGCSYRESSVDFRQRLSFRADQVPGFLTRFRDAFPATEVVLLSTCNRVELYTATDNGSGASLDQETAFLAEDRNLTSAEVSAELFRFEDYQTVHHLFKVASSLDSMVLGEVQILNQIRHAYQLSIDNGSIGPLLHSAFQTAVKTARRVAVETEIHRHRLSIASVAVKDFASNIFETFADKQALVIGAGEMAEETLVYLKEEGVHDIVVVNRSFDKAVALSESHGGRAEVWDRLPELLRSADLIISATGSPDCIVTAESFAPIHKNRRGNPAFIVDLAVPRDFDPRIGNYSEVYLYSIDDLEQTCQRNRLSRQKQLPKATAIVETESRKFLQSLVHRESTPILTKLREGWLAIKDAELERLFNKRPDLTDEDRQAIVQSFDRLVNKLLHNPYEAVRNESQTGVPNGLLESIAKLFRLG